MWTVALRFMLVLYHEMGICIQYFPRSDRYFYWLVIQFAFSSSIRQPTESTKHAVSKVNVLPEDKNSCERLLERIEMVHCTFVITIRLPQHVCVCVCVCARICANNYSGLLTRSMIYAVRTAQRDAKI